MPYEPKHRAAVIYRVVESPTSFFYVLMDDDGSWQIEYTHKRVARLAPPNTKMEVITEAEWEGMVPR